MHSSGFLFPNNIKLNPKLDIRYTGTISRNVAAGPSRKVRKFVPVVSSLDHKSSIATTNELQKLATSTLLPFPAVASKFQNFFETTLSHNIDPPPLHPSVDPKHVFTGNFSPVHELEPTNCAAVEGKLPTCLNGVYIRSGPNPQHKHNGPLHLFEGDGMLHSVRLWKGQATYCSRYVKTYKYIQERDAGFPIFPNMLSGAYSVADVLRFVVALGRVVSGRIDLMKGFGIANTSVAFFSNKFLALGETDLPYSIRLTEEGDIQTLERWEFNRKMFANMTAHPKVDVDTNEAFAFRCSPLFPYITYFRFDEDGNKQNDVPILSISRSAFIHDFALTNRCAIFPETQLVIEPLNVMLGRGMPVVCDPSKVPRIGVMPRYASNDSEIKWFPVPGFNALHVINAWDSGEEEIVIVAPNAINVEHLFHRIDEVHFSLEKLTINLRTGKVSRTFLSERNLELGSINPLYVGRKNRYAYLGIGEKLPRTSGFVKIDLETGCEVSTRFYESGWFGGEPLFVAKDTAGDPFEEDNGFVVTYVHDENSGESSFLVMDAKSPKLEILAAVKLPRRVPYGFHGLFVTEKNL